ncbi:DUF3034 family protein [Novosphingobium sp. PS1R-30]|uniref:DUF3034 family protein n=1 Tax=Novosphingobium anseongense TaxID=3133436 RepID=A0ABU8S2S6_9SPHN
MASCLARDALTTGQARSSAINLILMPPKYSARMLGRPITLAALLALGISSVPGAAHAQDLFEGGKLLLTNGISTVEGSGGGGLATWATISGLETGSGIGITGHVTVVELPDYGLESHGIAVGIGDRLEFSYARQNFDTRMVGAALGLGKGYTLNQDIYGAKLRLLGDAVYGKSLLPQLSIGVQHKRNLDGPVARAVGARHDRGTDFTLSATKLFLRYSLLVNTTFRLTKANQLGLLGYGSDRNDKYSAQFEGSIAYQLSRRLVVGGEYRTKPDNLAIAHENDAKDVFVAYALTRNVTLTGAYADLGSIATFGGQRGAYLSAQLAF